MNIAAYKPRDKYDRLILSILNEDYVSFIMKKLYKHDPYTFWHCISVAKESLRIADCIGQPLEILREVGISAILHDIGKINIPAEIIRKTGSLSSIEFDFMKQHPMIGADMVHQSGCYSDRIIQGIRNHHINLDGTGYGAIKLDAPGLYERIIRIADSFDAMTDNRPYHHAWTTDKAVLRLRKERGTVYDPFLLDVFTSLGLNYKIDKANDNIVEAELLVQANVV